MARQYRRFDKEQVEVVVAQCSSLAEVLRTLGRAPVGGNSTNLALLLKRWGTNTSHFTGRAHAKGKKKQQP